ncbi:C-C motif chemokine 28 [Elgaria multicarinata webbii]|uniref:C-C motif chemokine 28 n=1 Tax=Elgaria multicarinata webbii TaxID=159646 RepID=UPI002FCCBE6A
MSHLYSCNIDSLKPLLHKPKRIISNRLWGSMNLSIILITLGIVTTHHISEAVFPIFFDCCTEVAHFVPRSWLRRSVVKFEIQQGGDLCKIPAVILHTRHKKLCASPQNKNVKKWMKQMVKRRQRKGLHTWKRWKGKKRRKNVRKQ